MDIATEPIPSTNLNTATAIDDLNLVESTQVDESEEKVQEEEKVDEEKNKDEPKDNEDSTFECNICLDTAKDAVVSMCGHLFCWPCLHQWLETRPMRQVCPVCKAGISKDKVIPLYGRGSSNQDPRNKVPPRPQGQRTEPTNNAFQGMFADGFHMSFGIGAFPFGFFASTFNYGDNGIRVQPGVREVEEEQFLSKVFLWVALLFIFWLLVA